MRRSSARIQFNIELFTESCRGILFVCCTHSLIRPSSHNLALCANIELQLPATAICIAKSCLGPTRIYIYSYMDNLRITSTQYYLIFVPCCCPLKCRAKFPELQYKLTIIRLGNSIKLQQIRRHGSGIMCLSQKTAIDYFVEV